MVYVNQHQFHHHHHHRHQYEHRHIHLYYDVFYRCIAVVGVITFFIFILKSAALSPSLEVVCVPLKYMNYKLDLQYLKKNNSKILIFCTARACLNQF